MEERTQGFEDIRDKAHWRAYYNNGSTIEQLGNTIDIKYDNIDKEKLYRFFLMTGKRCFGVDLHKGFFVLGDGDISFDGFSNKEENYRLIYYVKENEDKKAYHLGMQITRDNKNLKKIIRICHGRVSFIE